MIKVTVWYPKVKSSQLKSIAKASGTGLWLALGRLALSLHRLVVTRGLRAGSSRAFSRWAIGGRRRPVSSILTVIRPLGLRRILLVVGRVTSKSTCQPRQTGSAQGGTVGQGGAGHDNLLPEGLTVCHGPRELDGGNMFHPPDIGRELGEGHLLFVDTHKVPVLEATFADPVESDGQTVGREGYGAERVGQPPALLGDHDVLAAVDIIVGIDGEEMEAAGAKDLLGRVVSEAELRRQGPVVEGIEAFLFIFFVADIGLELKPLKVEAESRGGGRGLRGRLLGRSWRL